MPAMQGQLIDRSSTITLGNASQLLAPPNPNRLYFYFQNNSAGDLWLNFGRSAALAAPSIKVPTNVIFVMENSFVSNEAIHIIGATTAQAFTAKEA